jgi:hypothetical protein
VGREHLTAVDPKAFVVGRRGGPKIGDRGASLGFGHGDGNQTLTCQQLGKIGPFLVVATVFGKDANRAEVTGLNDIRAARADKSDGFNGDD